MITVESLIPESLREDANHLACAKGLSMADMLTFGNPTHEDGEGSRFIWVGAQVSDGWVAGMQQPVTRPDFDTSNEIDLAAAQAVLSNATILVQIPETPPDLSKMVVLVGTGLAGACGLTRITD